MRGRVGKQISDDDRIANIEGLVLKVNTAIQQKSATTDHYQPLVEGEGNYVLGSGHAELFHPSLQQDSSALLDWENVQSLFKALMGGDKEGQPHSSFERLPADVHSVLVFLEFRLNELAAKIEGKTSLSTQEASEYTELSQSVSHMLQGVQKHQELQMQAHITLMTGGSL